jgi:hypothetical protein
MNDKAPICAFVELLFVKVRTAFFVRHCSTLPKFTLVGETVNDAATKFAVTLCGAVMVTVVEVLLALATLPVQLENA